MRDSLRRSGRGHSQEFLESLINELGVLIAEATASEVAVHTRNLMIEGIGQVLHLVLVVLRWEIKIDGGCRIVCVCVCVCQNIVSFVHCWLISIVLNCYA